MDNLWEFSISPLKSSVLSIVCVGNTVTLVLCHVFLNEHFFFPLTKLGVNISYLFDGNFGIHLVIFFFRKPRGLGMSVVWRNHFESYPVLFLQKHDKTPQSKSPVFWLGIVSSWFPFWPGVDFSTTQNLMHIFSQFVRTTPAGHREWTCLLLGFLDLGSAWRPWIFFWCGQCGKGVNHGG